MHKSELTSTADQPKFGYEETLRKKQAVEKVPIRTDDESSCSCGVVQRSYEQLYGFHCTAS